MEKDKQGTGEAPAPNQGGAKEKQIFDNKPRPVKHFASEPTVTSESGGVKDKLVLLIPVLAILLVAGLIWFYSVY